MATRPTRSCVRFRKARMTPEAHFARVWLIVERCRGSDGDLDAISLSQGQALRLTEKHQRGVAPGVENVALN